MLRVCGWVAVGVLLACAAFELALSLGAGRVGPAPGDDVAGQSVVLGVAFIAMLAAIVLAGVFSGRPHTVAALLAPSAALFLLFFWRTYDPYYAPQQRRYSDGGAVSEGWMLVVLAAAAGAALFTHRDPRRGAVVTMFVLALVLVTTLLAGDGH